MGAPTNAAYVKKSPCQLGAVHTWGQSRRAGLLQSRQKLRAKRHIDDGRGARDLNLAMVCRVFE
jgi:hypothetical protein